jgi:hypothetical protein
MIYQFNKATLKYVDAEGVIKLTSKPERDHDNPHLFNGYACMFLDLAGYSGVMGLAPKSFADSAELFTGLYRRFKSSRDIVSHDEYNGILAIGEFFKDTHYAKNIVNYGEAYNWQFNNTREFESVSFLSLLKRPNRTYKMINSVNDNGIDEAEKEFEELTLLRYTRSLRDRFMYKVCAGLKPSTLELLYFCAATIVTSRKAPGDYANGSSQLQAILRFWILKKVGYSNRLLTMTIEMFFKNQEAKSGYLGELTSLFFKDENHPFHDLAWEVDIRAALGVEK